MKEDVRNHSTTTVLAPRPRVELDIALYQSFLDDADISDTQKEALIETLWSIVTSFIDLGFGVHPAQAVEDKRHPAKDNALATLVADFDRANIDPTPNQKEKALPERQTS